MFLMSFSIKMMLTFLLKKQIAFLHWVTMKKFCSCFIFHETMSCIRSVVYFSPLIIFLYLTGPDGCSSCV